MKSQSLEICCQFNHSIICIIAFTKPSAIFKIWEIRKGNWEGKTRCVMSFTVFSNRDHESLCYWFWRLLSIQFQAGKYLYLWFMMAAGRWGVGGGEVWVTVSRLKGIKARTFASVRDQQNQTTMKNSSSMEEYKLLVSRTRHFCFVCAKLRRNSTDLSSGSCLYTIQSPELCCHELICCRSEVIYSYMNNFYKNEAQISRSIYTHIRYFPSPKHNLCALLSSRQVCFITEFSSALCRSTGCHE